MAAKKVAKKKIAKKKASVDTGALVEYIISLIPPKEKDEDYPPEDMKAADLAFDTILWIKANEK